MVNIIYPSHTSKELKALRENTMHELGEKHRKKIFRKNAFYNALSFFILLSISLCFTKLTLLSVHKFIPLAIFLALSACAFGLFAIGAVEDLFAGTITSRTRSKLKEYGCPHPMMLEKSFQKVITEAERIEQICDIIKKSPHFILQETDDYGVRVEYIENNFQKAITFTPNLPSYYDEHVVKNDALDFSYLDRQIDKYLK